MSFIFTKDYKNPAYLTEGMEVFIPYRHEGKIVGLKCKVTVACGDAGRVVCEKFGINKWVHIDDMAVKDEAEMV